MEKQTFEIQLFNATITFLIGEKDEVDEELTKAGVSTWPWPKEKEKVRLAMANSRSFFLFSYTLDGDSIFYAQLARQVYHIVNYLFRSAGIRITYENEEIRARLIETIYRLILPWLNTVI